MIIDVSELFNKQTVRKEIHLDLKKDNFFYENEFIQFSKPVKLNVILKAVGDEVDLTGSVETELLLACSRCLEIFPYPIKIQLNEKLSKTLKSEAEDIIFVKNDKLDFNEIVESNIISMLPIKRLCNKDCKGLCQQCGINLNYDTCKCGNDEVDPRLAKLKDLFSTD